MNGYSKLAIIAALVAISAFGTGVVLFGFSASTERVGMLFVMFGTIVTGLLVVLKSDQAQAQTDSTSKIAKALDGKFEQRVRTAVRDVRDEPKNSKTADDSPVSRTPTTE